MRSSVLGSATSHSRSSRETTAGRAPGFTCAKRALPSPSQTASQPSFARLRKGKSSFISGTAAHRAIAPLGDPAAADSCYRCGGIREKLDIVGPDFGGNGRRPVLHDVDIYQDGGDSARERTLHRERDLPLIRRRYRGIESGA